MPTPAVMWFRQDLRLADNAALKAAAEAGPLVCVYVLDDATPGGWAWGAASRWWLHNSLVRLAEGLARFNVPLVLRRGPADKVIAEILHETGAASLHFTRDYAPWSGALEQRVKTIATEAGAACHRYGGFLLHEPEAIRTGQGQPYKVFTPFSRACFALGDPRPPRPAHKNLKAWEGRIKGDKLEDWRLLPRRPDWSTGFAIWTPGEQGARQRIETFIDDALSDYAEGRDRPDLARTSRLSPHLHWGEISPVQCWTAIRSAMAAAHGRLDRQGEKFLSELLWRDFSYHLLHHWPDLPSTAFQEKFAAFPWRHDPKALRVWQRGETGYPIVDAGLRELWATGYMHNRVRMIAASFLIKDLLIDWRQGETWFWDTLVDADIANNAASWQWVAGSGADAAPYFRIFNPVLQGEKFDPEGDYVRKWCPELRDLPNAVIHRPWEHEAGVKGYPARIVDHAAARHRALLALKSLS
ncbi:deoxyribodipyrimidine photo-lyase [Aestuariivirga sp. YIM B02566]|uniref:Deoxyribodipyrimidine photo-lyase n=2 Tax=Taklimakanibacter albus TaxID=2800327 RepID=A0ACC5RDN1_9HYPH|nr:deoxyribodipyrimidine photo-lyase [Aestuariivirga sp. YIM B02566]MBK1870809.1 deoxyribodipyrimidine photo-lyase [Aestuariivirga sp. YIM B02566]